MNKLIAAFTAVIALLAVAVPASASAPAAHIREFTYSQDYEGIGRHYTVGATIKGDADRVSIKGAGGRTSTRLSGHISPGGRDAHFWIVDDRDWIRSLRTDLRADGAATVRVRAVAGGQATRKSCALDFEPDPEFGDFAAGPCHRLD